MLQEIGRGPDRPGSGLGWKAGMALSLGKLGPGPCTELLGVLAGGACAHCAQQCFWHVGKLCG